MTRFRDARRLMAACLAAGALTTSVFAVSCRADEAPAIDPLPGAEIPSEKLAAIRAALAATKPGEAVRTKHVRTDGSPRFTNRLVLETSPYLRQHAHNPVNWYPWSDEAFDDARRLGRPVLLSIGYSTCHWCHVMEEESFEDEEIARFLNEHFVAIKVDREQRPDLDSIYMTAVTLATGRGGWPMTVWLTPDRKPFYAGTYFPPRDGSASGMPGFLTVLRTLDESYRTRSADVAGAADDLATQVRARLAADLRSKSTSALDAADTFEAAVAAARARFDPVHGGTKGGHKFPTGLPLRALLRYARRSGDASVLAMVTKTLDGMASGGIRDHLAGGFHRYSVDPEWKVPHFEKMLYDNALLAVVYTEAWQATGDARYLDVARETVRWIGREMTSPYGTFYSATDADSRSVNGEMIEGYFFTWTTDELDRALGADAPLFAAAYGVAASGPVEGRSVLRRALDRDALAERFSLPAGEVDARLDKARAALLDERNRRPRPLRDEKILTTWNALAISAAATLSSATGDAEFLAMGRRAADALLKDWNSSKRLVHGRVGDRPQPEAFLEDHAFVEAALLDLFDAGDGAARLQQAIAIDGVVERDFEDPAGGFFVTPQGRADLLVRERSTTDSVEPSGSSVAILNLLRLAEWTGEARYRERADRALASLSPLLGAAPLALADALVALDFASDAPKEIVLVANESAESLRPFENALAKTFVPNRIVLRPAGDAAAARLPLAEGKIAVDGQPTAYVCEAKVCDLPARDASTFASQIARVRPLRAPAAPPPPVSP